MEPARAHVYWNGAFSDEEKRRLANAPLPDALNGFWRGMRADHRAFWIRPAVLSAGRHSGQGGPDEHGALARSAAAVSRSPHRGVRGHAAARISRWRRAAEDRSEVADAAKNCRNPCCGERRWASIFRRTNGCAGRCGRCCWRRWHGARRSIAQLFPAGGDSRLCCAAIFERRANVGYQLWGLMILFLWMRRWRIQSTPVSDSKPRDAESIFRST